MINHWDISNILSQIPRTQMGAGRHGAPQGRGSDSQAPRCLWCLLVIELWRISLENGKFTQDGPYENPKVPCGVNHVFSCFFHPCFGMMIHSQLAHGVETTKQKCFLVHHPPHRPTTFIQLRVKTKTKPHLTGFHNISQIALVTPDEPESMWKS